MDASAIMTKAVVSVSPEETVRRAGELLDDLEIRHLPVLAGQRLVGIISDRDLREFRSPPELETPVSTIMTTPVISLDMGESVQTAIRLILKYKIGALPVVDRESGRLEGILSYTDILRSLLRPDVD